MNFIYYNKVDKPSGRGLTKWKRLFVICEHLKTKMFVEQPLASPGSAKKLLLLHFSLNQPLGRFSQVVLMSVEKCCPLCQQPGLKELETSGQGVHR